MCCCTCILFICCILVLLFILNLMFIFISLQTTYVYKMMILTLPVSRPDVLFFVDLTERFSGVKSSVIVSSSFSLSVCSSAGLCPRAPRLSTHRDCKQVCFQLAVSEVSWPANADERRRCCQWSLFLSRACCASFMGYQGLKGVVGGWLECWWWGHGEPK